MKKLILLSLSALLSFNIACSDDDNKVGPCPVEFENKVISAGFACMMVVDSISTASQNDKDDCYTELMNLLDAYPANFSCISSEGDAVSYDAVAGKSLASELEAAGAQRN